MMGQYHEDENAWDYLWISEDKRLVYLGDRIVSFELDKTNNHVVAMEECDRVFEATLNKVEMHAFIVALMDLYQKMT